MPTPWRVHCNECGEILEVADRSMTLDGDVITIVEPCKSCLETARVDACDEMLHQIEMSRLGRKLEASVIRVIQGEYAAKKLRKQREKKAEKGD